MYLCNFFYYCDVIVIFLTTVPGQYNIRFSVECATRNDKLLVYFVQKKINHLSK